MGGEGPPEVSGGGEAGQRLCNGLLQVNPWSADRLAPGHLVIRPGSS